MKKRIILGIAKSFNLYESIIKNLEFYGYEVISICYNDEDFVYKNFRQRVVNFFRKTVLNDKHYKNRLKIAAYQEEIYNIINQIKGKADYALLIRADTYTEEILHSLKQKSEKLIAYQWDGLNRFPAIFSFINTFDRFFIFDNADLKYNNKYNLLPITNFYFDYDNNIPKMEDCKIDVFFIGSLIRKRMSSVIHFANKAEELNLKIDFNIFHPDNKTIEKYKYKNRNVNFISENWTYITNISHLKKAKIVVDFWNKIHNGLSLRTFEAMYYNKKLITTNQFVKYYDFYHPNNIFIWDGVNLDGLDSFIHKPYVKIDEKIFQKYGFKNWINYVLDTETYTPISLP